eukprot:TRINITY_DN2519_c0_g1_i1.p2 TRINITY_DN2519_c0_g1~~TRINITY_DN2519_c0_g1_i1.p2  ORF type:complete len:53 (-),score=9.37 TRINITY_DN2519_c0_g1_i1:103-261(-)
MERNEVMEKKLNIPRVRIDDPESTAPTRIKSKIEVQNTGAMLPKIGFSSEPW